MRYRAALPWLGLLVGLLLMGYTRQPGLVAVTTAAGEIGYQDVSFFYQPDPLQPPPLVQTPTGEKPQSKLWFNDGRWWASMFNNQSGNYHIYWLDIGSQTWLDTGTVLDTRAQTKADCLWDGTHLYVASGGGSDPSGSGTRQPFDALLYRYSYSAATKTYSLDSHFPVTIRTGGAETIVIDKDSSGMLWVTYTQGNHVYVNHSRTSDFDWNPNVAPFQVADANPSVSADDISSLTAVDGKIVVFWSNQAPGQFPLSTDTAFYYAAHVDGAADTSWDGGVALRQPAAADDHINLKSLQADASGALFAMIKTSSNTIGTPQLLLLVAKKQPDGSYSWNNYVESLRQDDQTRPIVLIDSDHRQLYVFTSTESGGSVFYKQTSLDSISFASGKGTPFISFPGFTLNNITSTKQTVSSASGIVVLASHDNEVKADTADVDFYFHNYLSLAAPPPTATAVPTPAASGGLQARVSVPLVMR